MFIQITNAKQIGQAIRAVRKEQKFTQMDFGDLAGASHKFVNEIEKGKPTAQIGKVLSLLEELGITVHLDIPVSPDSPIEIDPS